jgi:hypothetical protein
VYRKALFWNLFFFNVFINDLCNFIKRSIFSFAGDLKIFRVINSPHDRSFLQSDINSVSDWCTANSMRLNIAKTSVVSYSRKKSVLSYEYQLYHAAITRTNRIKDLDVFSDSKLYFQNHVDFIFSECIKLLGLWAVKFAHK